jgi:hypothetical protein
VEISLPAAATPEEKLVHIVCQLIVIDKFVDNLRKMFVFSIFSLILLAHQLGVTKILTPRPISACGNLLQVSQRFNLIH